MSATMQAWKEWADLGDLAALALRSKHASVRTTLEGAAHDDVTVTVELTIGSRAPMVAKHTASGPSAARGFVDALTAVFCDRVSMFVDDKLEGTPTADAVKERIAVIDATIAEGHEATARSVIAQIKAWVGKRNGRPVSDDGTGFYTPAEWKVRGEKHGNEAVLVIVHDGGDLAPLCNYDYGCYDDIEAFSAFLGGLGYYVEDATGWYSAVYPVS